MSNAWDAFKNALSNIFGTLGEYLDTIWKKVKEHLPSFLLPTESTTAPQETPINKQTTVTTPQGALTSSRGQSLLDDINHLNAANTNINMSPTDINKLNLADTIKTLADYTTLYQQDKALDDAGMASAQTQDEMKKLLEQLVEICVHQLKLQQDNNDDTETLARNSRRDKG
jgi:hypothetical protein